MFIFVSILMTISHSLRAVPKKIVVVFLSEQTVSFLPSIKNLFDIKKFKQVAKNNKHCIPMGGGCFNPQTGFVESNNNMNNHSQKAEALSINKKDTTPKKLRTFNSLNTNLVDCQKGNYFDIFCGKAKKQALKKRNIEIYVDVSSSMKHVDSESSAGFCERRYFVSELKSKCKGVSVSGYDTRLISNISESRLCINYGLNDRKLTVKWIKNSDANYLIAITDLEEYQGEMRKFLDQNGAKLYGLGTRNFLNSNLKTLIPSITKKYCVK